MPLERQNAKETTVTDNFDSGVTSHLYAATENIIPNRKPLVQDIFWKTFFPHFKR